MPPVQDRLRWEGKMYRTTMEEAMKYMLEVRSHLRHDKDKYTALLHLFIDFKSHKTTPERVLMKVEELLKDHPTLISGLNRFLPEQYVTEDLSHIKQQALYFTNKVKRVFQNEIQIYQKFQEILESFVEGEKTKEDVYCEVKSLFRHNKGLFNEFRQFVPISFQGSEPASHLQNPARPPLGHAAEPSWSKENFLNKPDLDLDPSQGECCTPSYRLFQENDHKPVSPYRTDLCREVLNNKLICVPHTCSSEHNSKEMFINSYEKRLFICEDERYELDMLIESVIDTLKHIENLLEKIRNNAIKGDGHIQIEEYFTAMNLRRIREFYGDKVLDFMMDKLRKDPVCVLPAIRNRLQQKQAKFMKCRDGLNKKWAKIHARNYKKSLHRSFEKQDKP